MPLPLTGIVVADFTRILAGPLCTMMLGDAGARVIKIEEPDGDETRRWGPPFVDGESAYFLSVNRNKESIAINLKTADGLRIAKELIRRADVIVENFLPEQKKKFGLDPRSVRRSNPRAIVASITGFPSDGPDAGLPGYDLLAQAAGGLMAITGTATGPPTKAGVALADVLAGHYVHGAVLTALIERERTGRGSTVEISLLASMISSLINVAQSALVTGNASQRYGNEHPSIVPYQLFTARGGNLVIAIANDRHWKTFCSEVLSDEDLAQDSRFSSNAERVSNRDTLIPLLESKIALRPRSEWIRRCQSKGIPAAAVRGPLEVLEDRTLVEQVDHPTLGALDLIRTPVRGTSRRSIRRAPPLLGDRTSFILRELGYDRKAIARLRLAGAIR